MTSASWYRKGVWYFRGSKAYTKAGFEQAKARFNDRDLEDIDCSDRHFLITGANSGLGLATAVEIAKRGGILHLVCRNATTMKDARSQIITDTGNDKIFQHQLNLSKPREVFKWASEFVKSHDQLDVLVHNAGCMIHERIVDADGVESNFAVNTLAPHILTETLKPLLERSRDGRVIFVSSAGMLTVKLDPHDLSFEKMKPFDGILAYAQTKRQQVIMTLHYAQKYEKIHFYAMHPGWADTPAVRTAMPEFYEQMKGNLRTPEQGADTIVWLALSEAATKHPSGLFFEDRNVASTHLPLAWTRSSVADEELFFNKLDELMKKCSHIPMEVDLATENLDSVFSVCSQIKNNDQIESIPEELVENVDAMDEHTLFEKLNITDNQNDSSNAPIIPILEGIVTTNVADVDSLYVAETEVEDFDQSEVKDSILNNNVDDKATPSNTEEKVIGNSFQNVNLEEPLEKF